MRDPSRSLNLVRPRGVLTLCLAIALACCSVGAAPAFAVAADPMADLKNRNLSTSDRANAVEAIWNAGQGDRLATREVIKNILWNSGYPQKARIRAVMVLANDTLDVDSADTRNSLRLRLPLEPDVEVIGAICRLAAERKWIDFVGPIVRSYARQNEKPDAERPERAALLALRPDKPIEAVVFDVFVTPATGEGKQREWAEKARLAAWELLARLDSDGSRRAAMLAEGGSMPADKMVESVAACARDLKCVPLTAPQLEWLNQLRAFDNQSDGAARRQWWQEASAASDKLSAEQRVGFQLRHAEIVRWVSVHHPDWLAQDKAGLWTRLLAALDGRPIYPRTGSSGPSNDTHIIGERPRDWQKELCYGDLLVLLVLDEAIKTPGLAAELWKQIELDNADSSTEYGGLLEVASGKDGGPGFRATLFPPRGSQRQGDKQFVASDDMLAAGGWAIAHYHFHAQKLNNSDYAGPGPGDIEFAQQQGRNCLVITPLGDGKMDVDYYQANGARIDLGAIKR